MIHGGDESFDIARTVDDFSVAVVCVSFGGAVEFRGDDGFCLCECFEDESRAWVVICREYGDVCDGKGLLDIGQGTEEEDSVFYAESLSKCAILRLFAGACDEKYCFVVVQKTKGSYETCESFESEVVCGEEEQGGFQAVLDGQGGEDLPLEFVGGCCVDVFAESDSVWDDGDAFVG